MTARSDRVWWLVALLEAAALAVLVIDLSSVRGATAPSSAVVESSEDPGSATGEGGGVTASAMRPGSSAPGPEVSPPEAEQHRGPLALPDDPTTVVHGRITDGDGAPLLARFALMPSEDVSDERLVSGRVGVADDGRYSIPGLEPGGYRLEVSADDHRTETLAFEIFAGTSFHRLDAVLRRTWKLRVKVRAPDGQWFDDVIADWREKHASPISTVLSVIATEDPLPQRLPDPMGSSVTRLGLGRWEAANKLFGGVPMPAGYIGVLELPEPKPLHIGLVFAQAVLASEQVAAGQEELEFELGEAGFRAELGAVRMRLVDGSSGAPLAGIEVRVRDDQRLEASATSDGAGMALLEGLAPSPYDLSASAAGGIRSGDWRIVPEPGVELDLGDVPLHVPSMVSFECDGPESDAEVYLSIRSLDAPSHPALRPRDLTTVRREGAAEARLTSGRWMVHARCQGWRGFAAFDTADLEGRSVRIVLRETAGLEIQLPDDGRRLGLRLVDGASGVVILDRWLGGVDGLAVGLPPGRYRAEVENLVGERTRHQVVVTAEGGTLDLRAVR